MTSFILPLIPARDLTTSNAETSSIFHNAIYNKTKLFGSFGALETSR